MDSYQKFISEKAKKKRDLLGKMFFPRQPVLLIDLGKQKFRKDIKDLLKGLSSIRLTTLVIGGKMTLPDINNVHWMPESSKSAAYEAADFVIALDSNAEPILEKGCVPIAQMDGDGTVDYNPIAEKGNGFYFKNPTAWEIFAAIVRALETYKFPYDWENLIMEVLKKKS